MFRLTKDQAVISISTDRTLEHFSWDRTLEHFSLDRTLEHFSLDRTLENFSLDRTLEHFSSDRTLEHFSLDRTLEHFSLDRTLEHFSLDRTLVLFRSDLSKMLVRKQMKYSDFIGPCNTGSTFEFPSQVNLSGPNLYCIARTLGKYSRHSIGLAVPARLTRSDFRLNLLLLKGQRFVVWKIPILQERLNTRVDI